MRPTPIRCRLTGPTVWLHDDRTCLVGNLCLYALQIIKIRKFNAADQRFERILIMRISCYRKRSKASSMEGMVHRDDLVIIAAVF